MKLRRHGQVPRYAGGVAPVPRKIALVYDARYTYDLKVMSGVASFLQERRHYSIYIEENALKDQRLPDLGSWHGDGIIANFDDPTVARLVRQSKLPVVGYGGGRGYDLPGTSIPYFSTNNRAIAAIAAEHLLERGFRHFAYCGYARTPINGWSAEREAAFVRFVRSRGGSCTVFADRHRSPRRWAALQRALGDWLRALPKPVAVMAANDHRGRQLLDACRAHDLTVPDEVAVVGVDNDELLCRLSSPPLTSIEQGARNLGYGAAALLDALMEGKPIRRRRLVIDPVGVVTRQSTDVLAVDDPAVARAMSFIRARACDGIKVPHVVAFTAISRSGLEARFRTVLGSTIRTAIRRVQLERARHLVTETNLPLKQVASDVGFRSVQQMTTLFKDAFGRTPATHRRG
jgi:LacI family transcriptional regulator